jgi:hypothetical protein
MIKVYFSCDLYFQTNLTYQLKTLIDRYYSRRLKLISLFSLPLIEISIVRLSKSTTTITTTTTTTKTASPMIELKNSQITIRPRFLNDNSMKFNRTVTSFNNLILLKQIYQPIVIVPLAIIAIGLFICAIIACCLCCNRRSSSSSTLLLPSGPSGSPNNKHLYQNYSYRKHKQQYEFQKKKSRYYDQRQFISKGKFLLQRKIKFI